MMQTCPSNSVYLETGNTRSCRGWLTVQQHLGPNGYTWLVFTPGKENAIGIEWFGLNLYILELGLKVLILCPGSNRGTLVSWCSRLFKADGLEYLAARKDNDSCDSVINLPYWCEETIAVEVLKLLVAWLLLLRESEARKFSKSGTC